MSLSAREQRILGCIADEIADSAPELASLLSTFNRLTSGEEMPERRQAAETGKCERQRSRQGRRRPWSRVRASPARQRMWPVIAVLTFIGAALIVMTLMLILISHKAGGSEGCRQSWPIVAPRTVGSGIDPQTGSCTGLLIMPASSWS